MEDLVATVPASALVTGATGFIGGALVRRLSHLGWEVSCPVRPGSDTSRISSLEGVTLLPLEDSSLDAWTSALGGQRAEVVFHLAAYGVRPQDRDLQTLIAANVVLPCHLVELVRHWSIRRFVHMGSCAEYALVEAPERLHESAPLLANTTYGASKASGFLCARTAALRAGVPYVNLRSFGVYGPGEAPHRLFPSLLRGLRQGEPVPLSSGHQQRDLIHVDDAVSGLIAIGTRDGVTPGEAYNLCSGEGVPIRDVALAVARAMNCPTSLLSFGALEVRPGELMWLVGNPDKLYEATGWRASIGLDEGVRRTIAGGV